MMRSLLLMIGCGVFCALPVWAEQIEPLPKGQPTELSGTPWEPDRGAEPKVIYGTDDRVDVYQVTDETMQEWAASTCALVFRDDLQLRSDGNYDLELLEYEFRGLPPCSGEAFADQPTLAYCSGFQVGS